MNGSSEIATFNLQYFDIGLIKKEVELAANLAGISVQETGVLGKRTKFQQNDVAQLTLDVENTKIQVTNQVERVKKRYDNYSLLADFF